MIDELKSRLSHGVTPAMATPIHEDQTVNTEVLEQLIGFLLHSGVKGLFVGGSTGEGILLEPEQRKILHEHAVDIVAGEVPVLVHVGANTTSISSDLARHAARIGADAIVVITPFFYPMHDDALLDYFSSIASIAPRMPLLVYDIPQMAINGISPDLVRKMKGSLANFAGFKTSRPDAQVIRRLIDAAEDRLIVLAGNESIALGSLALGANGLISGLSTAIPEPFVALTAAFSYGEINNARSCQRTINQLIEMLPAGARIGAIKQILAERGIAVGPAVPPRPMPERSWAGWQMMSALLQDLLKKQTPV